MAMDEQPLQLRRWSMQLQRGEDLTLIASDDEPFVVTEVFLVDPQNVASQGVVSAYVEMGTRNIMLAQLSSEVKAVELENPLVLEEEFRVYVMRPGGDSDPDTLNDEDAVVVQFKGFMVSLPWYLDTDTDEKEEDEEDAGSEDDETEDKDEKSDGLIEGDVATESSNAKEIDISALRTLLGLFLFTFMILAFCI